MTTATATTTAPELDVTLASASMADDVEARPYGFVRSVGKLGGITVESRSHPELTVAEAMLHASNAAEHRGYVTRVAARHHTNDRLGEWVSVSIASTRPVREATAHHDGRQHTDELTAHVTIADAILLRAELDAAIAAHEAR